MTTRLFYSFKECVQKQLIKREYHFNCGFARDVTAAMSRVNVENKLLASDKLPPTCPLRLCQVKLSLRTGYKPRIINMIDMIWYDTCMTLACHREAKWLRKMIAKWLHSYSLLVSLIDSHPPLVSATRPLSVVFEMKAPPSRCTTWLCTSSKATELFPDDPKRHK